MAPWRRAGCKPGEEDWDCMLSKGVKICCRASDVPFNFSKMYFKGCHQVWREILACNLNRILELMDWKWRECRVWVLCMICDREIVVAGQD